MQTSTKTFERHRTRLRGIAYRMLGTTADAEEVVQDVWLRWHEAEAGSIDNAEAWLVTVTTRVSIDRLRAAKVQREQYPGSWLPEPVITDTLASPEWMLEHAGEVSLAFLKVLERLSPEARAAFLLHEVLDADYSEVARIIGRSEASCRQLVHRAKSQVREDRPRYVVSSEAHQRLLRDFAEALTGGDLATLRSFISEDAELISDGAGNAFRLRRPLLGAQRIAQLFYAVALGSPPSARLELTLLNGGWGILRFVDGMLTSAMSFETDGARISHVAVQRNPAKLARIRASFSRAGSVTSSE